MLTPLFITKQELATITAALEVWKEELAEGQEWIHESVVFKNYSALSIVEIDELIAWIDQTMRDE